MVSEKRRTQEMVLSKSPCKLMLCETFLIAFRSEEATGNYNASVGRAMQGPKAW